ncbi:hypothetical protein ACFE04_006469 [Oxalis oulophora]
MKIFVKTLKGSHFEIDVKPQDKIVDVKKTIESSQDENVYPAANQMIIYQGKLLKDDTTLDENNVAENSFLLIMLSKAPPRPVSTQPSTTPQNTAPPMIIAQSSPEPAVPTPSMAAPTPVPNPPQSIEPDVYGEATSNLVAGINLQTTIQELVNMGGGSWDRDTVIHALRAASNNPERAVDYLYSVSSCLPLWFDLGRLMKPVSALVFISRLSGIPEQAEVPPVAQAPISGQVANPPAQTQQSAAPATGPNANPLDLFPRGVPYVGSNASTGTLDFLRSSQQFQALRAMVRANPQVLQPMLRELGKQNPHLIRLIQEHQADFIRLINEPVEGEGNTADQLASVMPQSITVTLEEREAIERLEALGFDRSMVLEVFFACNKNEELAANYLLDHMHEFED